jgi:putative peptidoglycan lipid II flippase
LSKQDKLVRSAGVVSISVLASRVSGLVREIVMARLFGAGQAYDAFLLGFRIPNLTRDLFAEGALSSAFVPAFTHYLNTKTRTEAAVLANLVATAIIFVVGGLCVLGVIFSPELVGLLAPGFAKAPGKFELAVLLTRVMFPFLLLVALAAQAMGMLNACNRFAVPALSSTFFNFGSVAFGLLLGFWLGPRLGFSAIVGMAFGIVLGGALQLACQIPSLIRAGFSFRLQLDWMHPGLQQILRLMGPAILGNAAEQINVMVNTNFASQISDPVTGPNGPVSWLGYAFRFMQLPLGLFGVAIASATLPAISLSASKGDLEEFRQTLSRSLGLVFLLTVPSSVGLAALGQSMIGLIYEGGEFHPYDTRQTALALTCYAIGLGGYAALKVLTPAFYALDDSRTPMLVSLASILINYGVASAMIHWEVFGHAGLALATSAVALFGFLALLFLLRARLQGIHGRRLAGSVLRILLASAVMGGVVVLASHLVQDQFGTSRAARLTDLGVSIPLGIAAFYAVCRSLGVADLEAARRAMLAPLAARRRRARDKIGA